MLRLLFILACCFLLAALCASSSFAMPQDWADSWVRNYRMLIKLELPYKWGGADRTKDKGLDCSGSLWDTRPEQVKDYNWLKKLRADVLRKQSPPLKRSTSARMEKGLDGWRSVPIKDITWDVQPMDLGFTDGHVFAWAGIGKNGYMNIIHSRSSRGPTEEPLPKWISRKHPRYKRLTIGDR